MSALEIRHQIYAVGMEFVVREIFGEQKPIEFWLASRMEADALVERRRQELSEMVAAISPEARNTVEEAVHIDRLKAGHA